MATSLQMMMPADSGTSQGSWAHSPSGGAWYVTRIRITVTMSLSLTGSKKAPNLEKVPVFLAMYPSSQSVKQAMTYSEVQIATFEGPCLEYAKTTKGIAATRRRVRMVGTVRIFSVPPSALVEDAALAPLPRPLAALPAPRTPPEDMRDLLRVWTPAGAVALIALAVVTVDLIFELAVLTPAVALDTAVVFPARARPDIKHGEALRARLSKKKKKRKNKK
mmetsp:Transcript_6070/g.20891  ORF Transcript_6070/g.20891 Transcript_6070/m.20891 type:complete len:220 (-) Transcript_6070:25-684(-)